MGEARDPRDERGGVTGGMATGNDVLALGVEEEVDIEAVLARSRVPREADPDPDSMPMLPNTIDWTTTAVPARSSSFANLR